MAASGSMFGTQSQLAFKLLNNSAFQLSSIRTFNVCIHRSMVAKQLTLIAPLCASKQCRKLFSNRAKCVVSPLTLGLACFTQGQSCSYATQGGKSLTAEILKQKLGATPESDASAKPQDTASKSSGGDKKKSDDSWFSNKNAWKLGLVSLGLMGSLLGGQLLVLWGAPVRDPDGNELRDEFTDQPTWKAYPKRAFKELNFFKQMIQDPSSGKLLPDPLKEPWYQPPYTLVLEMTDVLVHPDWTLATGWRFKKRPAVEHFLQQIGPPLFEVVIYTHEQGFTAFPIIDALDQNGYVSFRLFRDATKYLNGRHVKDLDCLNRDLSKVIIVDCDPSSYQLHPRNALGLKRWKGNDDDRTLIDLAAFLRTVAMSGVEDIRTVLDHYNQFDDPLEAFKENQRLLQEQQEKQALMATQRKEQKSLAGNWSRSLTGLFR